MKNQSRHFSFAASEKKSVITLLITALLLIAVLLITSCRKMNDIPFNAEDPLQNEAASSLTARGISYYLSPTGNDNNAGTLSSPWFSLEKAWSVVTAGDVIYMRGGTYAYTTQQDLLGKNGQADALIAIYNYPGEVPVITGASNYAFQIGVNTDLIYFEGAYVHFKGLEIAHFSQKPDQSPWFGFRSGYMQNCIVENINYHDNGSAFTIRGDGTGNLIINSDFYRNQDPYSDTPYDGADGLAITFNYNTAAINTVRGCRLYWNADDGLDLWQNEGYVLLENNWSFYNGYIPGTFNDAGNGSGFKLGLMNTGSTSIKREVRNCVAFKNRKWGIVENNALTNMNIYNNSAINNGIWNYWFGSWGASAKTFRNNISMGGDYLWDIFGYEIGTAAIHSNNSWNGTVTANATDFTSMDSTQLLGSRQQDGSLPVMSFLHLATGSDLINAGMNVGLPFTGSMPDIGAFESGGVSSTPVNLPPTANAGADRSITIPTSSISITGTGTDPDGTIAGYNWSMISGPSAAVLSGSTTATLSASGLVAGTYVFRFVVTDNLGSSGIDDVNVTVLNYTTSGGSTAYGGTARPIPGTIQAEDYDNGGQNAAYNDLSAGNLGATYRLTDSPDLGFSSKENNVFLGWTQAGEWINYSVNISATRSYTLKLRVATASTGKSVRIEVDGVSVKTVSLPKTGGNDKWTTVSVTGVNLSSGLHTLRLYNVTGGQNINYISFQ